MKITLAELQEIQDAADGNYKRRAMALVDGQTIDAEVCDEIPCEQCGGPVRYVPVFYNGRYRAFAVCDDCQTADEF